MAGGFLTFIVFFFSSSFLCFFSKCPNTNSWSGLGFIRARTHSSCALKLAYKSGGQPQLSTQSTWWPFLRSRFTHSVLPAIAARCRGEVPWLSYQIILIDIRVITRMSEAHIQTSRRFCPWVSFLYLCHDCRTCLDQCRSTIIITSLTCIHQRCETLRTKQKLILLEP